MKIRLVPRLRDDGGQLAQGLGHQAGLEAHLRFAHLALDLGLGHQRGDRVDDDDVDGAGADQHLGDLEGLLAVVGLGDQQLVDVDAELLGVLRVEGVLGVDEGGQAAGLLGLGDDLEGERRLARGFRAEDLDDAAARDAADAERGVDRERAGRDDGDRRLRPLAEAHDRALAELALDLRQRRLDGAPLFVGFDGGHVLTFLDRGKIPRAPRAIIDSGYGTAGRDEDEGIFSPARPGVNVTRPARLRHATRSRRSSPPASARASHRSLPGPPARSSVCCSPGSSRLHVASSILGHGSDS